ncbi:hypothetical protein TI39_contig426g00018 [Zymoseptoria brevis]|uniref:Uncharacterized protein n=1 Tax=Zymoseptoria brevis TaxID=1047168 RepID=A0A0F4GLF5_9PEZI|nr:hypothetical protein TI39_contig426g00018 [Zymoseptoria brevis]
MAPLRCDFRPTASQSQSTNKNKRNSMQMMNERAEDHAAEEHTCHDPPQQAEDRLTVVPPSLTTLKLRRYAQSLFNIGAATN